MATKSYKWFFDLTENLLTKDVTNDYIATVKTLLPKTVDNLVDALRTGPARLVHRDGRRGGPHQAQTVCEHQPLDWLP